ncbi:hypothetical protein [Spirosoma koreense]
MKRIIMVILGTLLFIAGYSYTRRQAEYAATQSALTKPAYAKAPVVLPLKALPTFAF